MAAIVRRLASEGRFLRQNLGKRQVYKAGEFRSLSQTGDINIAYLDPVTGAIHARGPNGVYPAGTFPTRRKLTGARWENKCFIVTGVGQSVFNAAGVLQTSDDDPLTPVDSGGSISLIPPLAGKLLVPLSGDIPSPEGGSSPSNSYVWPSGVYAGVVDWKSGINYLRNSGKEEHRELPALSALIHFAAALPDSSRVLFIGGASGSTSYAGVMGNDGSITGYTWSEPSGPGSGQLVFNTFAQHYVQVGASWTVTGIAPAAANGTYTVTARTSTTITVAKATDPTAYVSGGTFNNRGIQLQNIRAAALYLAAQMELAGFACELFAWLISGHESDSTQQTFDAFKLSPIHLRREANDLATLINAAAAAPFILATLVNWARNNWRDRKQRIGEASWWARGWVKMIRDGLDTRMAAIPIYFAPQGNRSLVGSPHFGSLGSMRWGGKWGNVLIDLAEGTAIAPPGVLTASRAADSATLTATLTGTMVSDTTEVSDPGNKGVQLFTADIDSEQTRVLTDTALSSVTPGASLAVVAAATPDPRRNFLGIAHRNSTQTDPWCGLEVTAAVWDGSTTVTLTLAEAHGLAIGTTFSIFEVWGAAVQNTGLVSLSGSTGVTLKYARATSPGSFTAGGHVNKSGNGPVGNNYGNRSTLRLDTIRHYDITDGAPQPDYAVQDLIAVTVTPSHPGLADMESEVRTPQVTDPVPRPKIIFDAADDNSFASGNTVMHNLGSSGTADDVYNGDSSGSDARDLTHSATYNSKKRDGYLSAGASGGCFAPNGTPTVGLDMHKAWDSVNPNFGKSWGAFLVRYKQGAAAQYIWSTCAGEGSPAGAGAQLKFASHKPQLIVKNGASTVWSLTASNAAFADGDYVLGSWYFRNGGKSWLWVNGTTTADNATTFSSPASGAAQGPMRYGINLPTGSAIRRLVQGFEFHGLILHDQSSRDLEFGDLEPYINGLKKRHLDNAY